MVWETLRPDWGVFSSETDGEEQKENLSISPATISRLQLVQNAPAWLLTQPKKQDHHTYIAIHIPMASLHWLLVNFKIDFKILLIVYKYLHRPTPTHIELLTPNSSTRLARSSNRAMLAVACSWRRNAGDRAFSVVAPRLWRSPLEAMRQAPQDPLLFSSCSLWFSIEVWIVSILILLYFHYLLCTYTVCYQAHMFSVFSFICFLGF